MLIDTLFDSLVYRLRRSRRQKYGDLSPTPARTKSGSEESGVNQGGSDILSGAHNFVMNQPTLIDNRTQITHNFAAVKGDYHPVLEHIAEYAELDAATDSSARFPPPLCHPGTRLKIGGSLSNWLSDPQRRWNLIWLHGPAGTGKSAVAQTLAECCAANGRLGASFFFSCSNNRNDPNTVIPSLVYQLAVCLPHYKSLVAHQLANDPELLRKTRRTQFQKLIVEPFSSLQVQEHQSIQEPLLIVLDGLDECNGEGAQRDLLEMISEVVRLKRDFPIVWLVCSRPEAHLKYLFSRADFIINCGREELAIDAESIADVDLYLRDGLAGIRDHFRDAVTPTWPSEDQITKLSQKASGHFAFASTALRYVGDLTRAAPMSRFEVLLSYIGGIQTDSSDPLEAIDALYARILHDVPVEDLSTTMRILCYHIFVAGVNALPSAQILCNFLHIDQATFYTAFRKLHSVVEVPLPEAALKTRLRFFHTSFEDYLYDARRSKEFTIDDRDIWLVCAKLCLFWHQTDLMLFRTTGEPKLDSSHKHKILPALKWVSSEDQEIISFQVAKAAEEWCWEACFNSKWDEVLLSQIRNFDFRYVRAHTLDYSWSRFMIALWRRDASSGIIRTEPRSEVDLQLLEYMSLMTGTVQASRPAMFPLSLKFDGHGGEYFLLGFGSKAIVCWITGRFGRPWFYVLNADQPPSKERIKAYQAWVVRDGA